MSRPLQPLFAPRSLAIVGASDDATKYGGKCLHFLLSRGYRGRIDVIHPRADTVQGVAAVRSFDQLDHSPDLVIIALPAEKAAPVLEEAGRRGVRAAVVFGSGFAEAGEVARQDELRAIADRYGMQLLGPNTVGLIGGEMGMLASFAGALSEVSPAPGNVALVSQSGAMMGAIYAMACERGLRIGNAVNPGNEAVLKLHDFIAHFLTDPAVDVILVVVEGIRDGRAFRDACGKAGAAGKKIVVLKSGASPLGSVMAMSHTASLTGEDSVFDALVASTGIVRVRTLAGLLDAGLALAIAGSASAPGVGVFTGSGGAGVLLADAASREDVALPELRPEVQDALAGVLPAFAHASNPLDVTAEINRDLDRFVRAFAMFAADPGIGAIIVARGEIELPRAREFAHALVGARRAAGKPVLMLWLATGRLKEAYSILEEGGIPVFDDPAAAMAAAATILPRTQRAPQRDAATPAASHQPEAVAAWPEHEAKRVLAAHGFDCPEGGLARSSEEAETIARSLGPVVVMKLQVQGLAHKSDVGGVRLGVPAHQAGRVYEELETIAKNSVDGRFEGVLVEQMIDVAAEIIVGLRLDPNIGPYATLAPGGTQAELFERPLCALLPLGPAERDRLTAQPAVRRLLGGFRGGPAVEAETAGSMFDALEALAAKLGPDLHELEINPLAISRDGRLVAADALIVSAVQPQEIEAWA